MDLTRRSFLGGAGAAVLLAGLDLSQPQAARAAAPTTPGIHFLNRISYGVQPDELARVNAIGIPAYLEEQLAADQRPDPGLKRQMAPFRLLEFERKRLENLKDNYERARQALIGGMVTRAVYARAQLFERMAEFWSDHFNAASEGVELDYVIFQREAIRKYTFGKFSDLLLATAKSPAMLYYLDNFLNVAEHPNENYARELMELHTLGVDGGYTEEDVRQVARALSGWTVDDKKTGGFLFHLAVHDQGPKRVLGVDLPAGRGIEDGLDVLRILAEHPSTRRFVCRKLCVRFVSDNPPQSLIDRMVAVWASTGGQIKPVLRELFLSAEFAASQGQKLRRGLDFVIGALRAAGTEVTDFGVLESLLDDLAHIPYNWHPPNGYPDVAPAWVNTGALLARWNTAFTLTDGALNDPKGLRTALVKQLGRPRTVGELVDAAAVWVFGAPLGEPERTPIVTFASNGQGAGVPLTKRMVAEKAAAVYGLMLASPAYQWR